MNLKYSSLIIILISFILLIPGVSKNIFSLKLSTKVQTKLGNFESDAFSKERSILGTVKDLYTSKKYLVSFLILFFSILVPFIKGVILLCVLFIKDINLKKKFYDFINMIGKWSMADVFVVAVFLAFLSTSGEGSSKSFEVRILGMYIPVDLKTQMVSLLGPGFYFFLSYCLLSIASLHLVKAYIAKTTSEG